MRKNISDTENFWTYNFSKGNINLDIVDQFSVSWVSLWWNIFKSTSYIYRFIWKLETAQLLYTMFLWYVNFKQTQFERNLTHQRTTSRRIFNNILTEPIVTRGKLKINTLWNIFSSLVIFISAFITWLIY